MCYQFGYHQRIVNSPEIDVSCDLPVDTGLQQR